jgi:3-deoxy-D-manno-octulosonic-acid transferase
MLFLLYDIIVAVACIAMIPVQLFRGKRRQGIRERFGFLSAEKRQLLSGGGALWIHAVSVGETVAARSLVKGLRERYPGRRIVFSTVTETGREIAEKIPEIDVRIFFPFDTSFAVRRIMRAVSPDLVVIIETEIWPGFMREASRAGIPVMLANGRISDRSFRRYYRFRRLFRAPLSAFVSFCMQTREDARRIIEIGAPPERVATAGNLKYDLPVLFPKPDDVASLRRRFGVPEGVPVFTAASTHRGEEEIVSRVYREFVAGGAPTFLVLVPRHPERAQEAAEALRREGIRFALRSSGIPDPTLRSGEALLVDRVGELMDIFALSDVVFVGGSLVPTGGHNVLEPASRGIPVLFGPHMENFREIEGLMFSSGGGVRVADAEELRTRLDSLVDDAGARKAMGMRGASILQENSGATERHLVVIGRIIGEAP